MTGVGHTSQKHFGSAIAAVLLFLPTLYIVPHVAYLLIVPIVLLLTLHREDFEAPDLLLVLFVVLGYGNMLYGFWGGAGKLDPSDLALVLLPIAVTIARANSNSTFARTLVWITVIEALVVIVEAAIGMRTIAPGQAASEVQEIGSESHLLYNMRPYGLSSNSSVAALKVFAAVLLQYVRPSRKLWLDGVVLGILGLATVLLFNRTVLMALAVFFPLYYGQKFLRGQPVLRWLAAIIIAGALALGTAIVWDKIAYQLTRGSNFNNQRSMDSGRSELWHKAIEHIKHEPIFGNYGREFRILQDNREKHTHNSFLQSWATHGAVAVLLWIYVLLQLFTHQNFVYIVPMLLYASLQFAIFWNFSYFDVVFFWFLLMPRAGSRKELARQNHEDQTDVSQQ